MIKIQGTNHSGEPFNYVDNDHYWRYATDLNSDPDMTLIEVMSGDKCVFTIKAEIVVSEVDELVIVVE